MDDLRAFARRLYRDRPDITTGEAADAILDYLPGHPEGEQLGADLLRRGAGVLWREVYGAIRDKAMGQLQQGARQRGKSRNGEWNQLVMDALLTKVPLPEADESPTLAECGLLMVERSMLFMRKQLAGLGNTLALEERAAAQLRLAIAQTGDEDITVGEAHERGLIDWSTIVAA